MHRRVGPAFVLVVYLLLAGVVSAATRTPAVIVILGLVALVGLVNAVGALCRAVSVEGGAARFLGFYLGRGPIEISADQIASFRFHHVRQAGWGRPIWDVSFFEIHGANSEASFRISSWGWTGRRRLFAELRAWVLASQIVLDPLTDEKLRSLSGERVT
jgi:hypothetical protein